MRLSLAIEGFLLHRAGAGSINTMRDYRNTLRKWLAHIGDVDTGELAADHVRRFLYHLRIEEELSPKTVKNAWIGLSAFFTWLEGEMGVEHVIRRYKVKMPAASSREIIPLSKTDLRSLLLACERTAEWEGEKRSGPTTLRATRVRDRAIILELLDTDIRAAELCDLLLGDDRFVVPGYDGPYGWLALPLDAHEPDWDEVDALIEESYRQTAPPARLRELDARRPG